MPSHPANFILGQTPMLRRFFGFSTVFLAVLACSRDDTASAHPRSGPRSPEDGVAPRPAVIAPGRPPYRVSPVTTAGTINGTVDIEGTAPMAALVRPSTDQNVCGSVIVEKTVALSGTRVGGAIVWITDIRAGKPLPLERRFELANSNCTLDPFVQAITTDGTLNVSNDDRTVHTNRFINVGTGAVLGIAPFNDDGEVVPVDRFKEPAEIEIVSDRHPWAHAWMVVLDHPYYTQTAANGTFSIDGIPAGKYHVRAWHPSLGFSDDSVTVLPGQVVSAAFRIRPSAVKTPAISPPAPADTQPAAMPILPAASSTPPASSTPDTSRRAPPPA
ncbi:MAG TPA: hypothetical protein VD771_04395 [Gemmatimonadaceae bacterium]|nr:hypothetical protein [Gemmatimonadaceae bacterium]